MQIHGLVNHQYIHILPHTGNFSSIHLVQLPNRRYADMTSAFKLLFDFSASRRGTRSYLLTIKDLDAPMIVTIGQHIEELRIKLANAFDATECRQVEAKLKLVQAELVVVLAEQRATLESESPF